MKRTIRTSCYLVGGRSLLVHCAEVMLARGHEVRGILTTDVDIRRWASEQGIPVLDPARVAAEGVTGTAFDWLLSIANTEGLPPALCALPQCGTVHFHDAPLERCVGLHCPSWALLDGHRTHGITWHLVGPDGEAADVLVERRFEVAEGDTALTLHTRCYEAGMESFPELLAQLETGTLRFLARPGEARVRVGAHDRPSPGCLLRFHEPAVRLEAMVRALDFGPYPNPLGLAKVWSAGRVVHVHEAKAMEGGAGRAPGTVLAVDDDAIEVATGQGILRMRGLSTPDGGMCSARQAAARLGMAVGRRIDGPEGDAAATLESLAGHCARGEASWKRALAGCASAALPWVEPAEAHGPVHTRDLRLPEGFGEDGVLALLAAWVTRVTGEAQAGVGVVVDGVPAALWELFVPVVPWVLDVPDGIPWEELVARVAERGPRGWAQVPLARDLFPRMGLTQPRLDVAVRWGADPDGKLEAPVVLELGGEAPRLRMDEGRIEREAVADIPLQLEAMAKAAAGDPSLPAMQLPLLSEASRHEVLEAWNDTERSLTSERCVHRMFGMQVERAPDAAALVAGDGTWTYRALAERVYRLAQHLRRRGVGPEVVVGLCLSRTADMVVAALAVQAAGGAYLPLDPSYPAERLAFMLKDSGAPVVVAHGEHASLVSSESVDLVNLDADAEAIAEEKPVPPDNEVSEEGLAYVIYTSGSTGTPKGVMVEHRQVANFFAGMDETIPRRNDGSDVWLSVTSLSFDISVLELFWTLTRGFRVVLASDGERIGVVSRPKAASRRPPGFSLFYFASDEGEEGVDKYALLLEGAKFADRHGFEAVWTPERHFHAFGGLYPNPSVAGAAIAAVTERVGIRAGSCVLPLHHPVRVAEEWALVDNLSKGRVGVSFAAGWQPNDFILRPESFADPKGTMLRQLEEVRRLWRGESLELMGPKGTVTVRTLPRPVQPELPVWLTAAGNPATFQAAGRAGAGLLTHLLGQSVDDLDAKIGAYRTAWREAGHPGEGHVTLMLHTFVGPDPKEVKEQVRGPMKRYLASALSLIREHAWSFPAFKRHARQDATFEDNFQSLSAEDTDALLEHSFERYYETSGLFGTPQQAMYMVQRAVEAGVDEIACLIDFGIDSHAVLTHLPYIDEVRASTVRTTEEGSWEDPSLAHLLDAHHVSHLQCTPSLARLMLADEATRRALRNVRHLLLGGEALPGGLVADLQEVTQAQVHNMYGPTETTVWSSVHQAAPCAGTVPIGRPIANTRMYVLDGHRQLVPVGVPGELYIGGSGVARGYLGRHALTAERFVVDPFTGGTSRMYRTGDMVRRRSDGVLEFLGRTDHQVKIRGHRVELGEVEACLREHESVTDGVVLLREDVPGNPRLVAYVVMSGATADSSDLRAYLRKRLPEPMWPAQVMVVPKLPLTPNGKVDRRALPVPPTVHAGDDARYEAPQGDVQEKVAAVWCRLLGLERVGTRDNFFDLGGHSLLAVQAHREIREALGVELTVTDIFRFPTVGALATHLEGAQEGFARHAERGAARRAAMLRRRSPRRSRADGGQ